MKVFVAGGSGAMGRRLVPRLVAEGCEVAAMTRDEGKAPWLRAVGAQPVVADALDRTAVRAAVAAARTEVIIHQLTALSGVSDFKHFDRGFAIAYRMLGSVSEAEDVVSEANCRQLGSRARRHVQAGRPRFEASREQRDRLAERFFAACQGRDVEGLVGMLATDAVLYGDGGTKGTGINRLIHGRDDIARMLDTWFRQGERLGIRAELVTVNGQPGARFLDPGGRLVNVIGLDIAGGAVRAVRSVINPDKLAHLGPLSPIGRRTAGDGGRGA